MSTTNESEQQKPLFPEPCYSYKTFEPDRKAIRKRLKKFLKKELKKIYASSSGTSHLNSGTTIGSQCTL
jgi:hypothetical protein